MATTSIIDSPRRRNRLRPVIWGGAALLLLLPAVAMRLTDEVRWTASDFVAMGVLLAIACVMYELAAWLSGDTRYRAAFGIAVVTGFLTVWVNLAVGMLGSEDNTLNLMFGGVLLVAAIGAVLARFRAAGLARAMAATAAVQVIATVIGVAVGMTMASGGQGGAGLYREATLTACFALPWLLSALLFRRAARAL